MRVHALNSVAVALKIGCAVIYFIWPITAAWLAADKLDAHLFTFGVRQQLTPFPNTIPTQFLIQIHTVLEGHIFLKAVNTNGYYSKQLLS